MGHLAADYNFILADKVLVLKKYGHKCQQYWLIAMWYCLQIAFNLDMPGKKIIFENKCRRISLYMMNISIEHY